MDIWQQTAYTHLLNSIQASLQSLHTQNTAHRRLSVFGDNLPAATQSLNSEFPNCFQPQQRTLHPPARAGSQQQNVFF